MRIDVLTLFPGMFDGPLRESILGRAQETGALSVHLHDLRQWGLGNYRQVDDKPYGGGAGMVLRPDVVVPAIEDVTKQGQSAWQKVKGLVGFKAGPHCIELSARGERLTQPMVETFAQKHEWLLLVCGHYEGIDQRVVDGGWIDVQLRIGDYVLTGGELPAMVLIDAVARQLPHVLGKEESAEEESFSSSLDRKREYPHYTRPEEFRGYAVPGTLLSGDHAAIEAWRRERISE